MILTSHLDLFFFRGFFPGLPDDIKIDESEQLGIKVERQERKQREWRITFCMLFTQNLMAWQADVLRIYCSRWVCRQSRASFPSAAKPHGFSCWKPSAALIPAAHDWLAGRLCGDSGEIVRQERKTSNTTWTQKPLAHSQVESLHGLMEMWGCYYSLLVRAAHASNQTVSWIKDAVC